MQRFELIKKIGSGAYSEVFKAWDYVTNTHVAIKQINHTNPDTRIVLDREIRILKKFSHPNIVKLLGCYSDKCYTYLILEYLPYDLITYYKQIWREQRRRLSDRQITIIFHQICQAIGYMHNSFNIMHRDVKPENVLIDPSNYTVKIIDFGFATEMNFYKKNTEYMVTRWYRPLQIVLGLPYDMKIDIFALGALLLQLYNGQEIFKSASNLDQLYWIYEICGYPNWQPAVAKMKEIGILLNPAKQPAIFQMTKKYRYEASNLIIGMLQPIPFVRLSIQDVLSHQYFSQFNQKKRRIISQQSYTSPANQSSINMSMSNYQNFNNMNTESLGDTTNKYIVARTDRKHNNRNLSGFIESGEKNFQPRRKSQMSNPIRQGPNYRSEHSIPQKINVQKRYVRDQNQISFQQGQRITPREQTRDRFKIAQGQNRSEEKRENRARSLKIEVTSLKKNAIQYRNNQYYTPKNGIPVQNQREEKMPMNNQNLKRIGPLKLGPNIKKDPVFAQKRNKIMERHDKIYPKDKISLSNRLMIPHSFEVQPSQVRNHMGLQINR